MALYVVIPVCVLHLSYFQMHHLTSTEPPPIPVGEIAGLAGCDFNLTRALFDDLAGAMGLPLDSQDVLKKSLDPECFSEYQALTRNLGGGVVIFTGVVEENCRQILESARSTRYAEFKKTIDSLAVAGRENVARVAEAIANEERNLPVGQTNLTHKHTDLTYNSTSTGTQVCIRASPIPGKLGKEHFWTSDIDAIVRSTFDFYYFCSLKAPIGSTNTFGDESLSSFSTDTFANYCGVSTLSSDFYHATVLIGMTEEECLERNSERFENYNMTLYLCVKESISGYGPLNFEETTGFMCPFRPSEYPPEILNDTWAIAKSACPQLVGDNATHRLALTVTNNSRDCFDWISRVLEADYEYYLNLYLIYLYVVFSLSPLSICLNILLIVVIVFGESRVKGRSGTKSLLTCILGASHMLRSIVELAGAVLNIFNLPTEYTGVSLVVCSILGVADTFSADWTPAVVFVITLDRFTFVCFPFKQEYLCSRSTFFKSLLFAATAVTAVMAMTTLTFSGGLCVTNSATQQEWLQRMWLLSSVRIIGRSLVLLGVFLMNSRIICFIWSQQKARKRITSSSANTKRSKEIVSTVSLVFSSFFFSVMCTASVVSMMAMVFRGVYWGDIPLITMLYVTGRISELLYSTFNLITFLISGSEFRAQFTSQLKTFFGRITTSSTVR